MSVHRTVGGLALGTVTTAARMARHPLGTAALAAGLVKGTAKFGVDLLRCRYTTTPDAGSTEPTPTARPATPATPAGEAAYVPPTPLREAAAPQAPGAPGEAFHHEPHAASRASAHGGSEVGDRVALDEYAEEMEADAGPAELADLDDGVVWSSSTEDGPVLDSGQAKAIRSEAEMLRRGAERDPGRDVDSSDD